MDKLTAMVPNSTTVEPFRIALANIPFPDSPDDSVARACLAIAEAGSRGARIVCFPECYVPGYRWPGRDVPEVDASFLAHAWQTIATAAAASRIGVILGTERFSGAAVHISALVIDREGQVIGFQDKVQLDPSEDSRYTPGAGRRVFRNGPLTFGIVICHEGFRYPETVRWAARQGAQVVFHPHYDEAVPDGYRPTTFAEPGNSFHEKAALCRAAENTCFFASVNCAGAGSPTTSAIVNPDGTLLSYQPYGQAGLLIADLDLTQATGFLAGRLRS
jgi:predicted amidohydrolase